MRKLKINHYQMLRDLPVIRLLGSKTSIFSARSIASGETFGNFCTKGCFGTCGSCLTYFLALSLLKNPRSESSGEPSSCFWTITNLIHQYRKLIVSTFKLVTSCDVPSKRMSTMIQHSTDTKSHLLSSRTARELQRKWVPQLWDSAVEHSLYREIVVLS